MALDDKDIKILDILKQNSRTSIRNIAKKTKIRPSTVHQRMTVLKKKGVIEKYTAKLDNKEIGESFIVFLFVKTKPNAVLDSFNDPHIKEVFGITGEHDLLLKLKFKDIEEFNDFLLKFRKEKPIENTLTQIATATIKEEL
jgi:Lrp/AsnC family leucine-responsive transcriptional regulator